jgi:Raf kinase inhibitor-like YbhB/YbcL family protein
LRVPAACTAAVAQDYVAKCLLFIEVKIMAKRNPGVPAETPDQQPGQETPLSIERPGMSGPDSIEVTSASFENRIAREQSEYYEGMSPALRWTPVAGAKSYSLIVEDPDAKAVRPFVHWVAWNIPGGQTELRLDQATAVQGKNSHGTLGYFGPRPPVGDPPHHYHFQIFALDAELELPAGAPRDELLDAMKGHVLAAGELVGVYQQATAP